MKKILSLFSILLVSTTLFAANNLIFKENYSISEIANLKVKLSSENLFFENIYGDELSVEIYCNYERKAPEAVLENDTLVISKKSSQITSGINYLCEIYLYIPENFKFNKVDLTLTSGDCKVDTLLSSEGFLSFTSGNLEADYLEIPTLNLVFTSGDARINEYRGESLISSFTSGNFTIDIVKAENLSVQSTSSDIKVKRLSCDYFDIISTNGNVDINVSRIIQATSRITTTSGDIYLSVPKNSDFEITVDTNSGDFIDDISGRKPNVRDGYYKAYNNGGPAFELITTSGNITLCE